MKRHAAKRYPKHVRRAVARLVHAGVQDIVVEIGRKHLLSWRVGTERMRIATSVADRGNAFEGLWAAIRALFRLRGLEVPA